MNWPLLTRVLMQNMQNMQSMQNMQNMQNMKSKVQYPHSISRTCLAQEFGLVSGVESIRILQMCFNLNIFLRVQRSHRVIRIQPSIRVSGTSVSAVSLSIKIFVVVHPVDKVDSRQLLFRTEIDK